MCICMIGAGISCCKSFSVKSLNGSTKDTPKSALAGLWKVVAYVYSAMCICMIGAGISWCKYFVKLGPGRPSAGGPRMDRWEVTSLEVVKISRFTSCLRRSARRGPDPKLADVVPRRGLVKKRHITDTVPRRGLVKKRDVTDAVPRRARLKSVTLLTRGAKWPFRCLDTIFEWVNQGYPLKYHGWTLKSFCLYI